jgi:hypothetical protein
MAAKSWASRFHPRYGASITIRPFAVQNYTMIAREDGRRRGQEGGRAQGQHRRREVTALARARRGKRQSTVLVGDADRGVGNADGGGGGVRVSPS